MQRLLNLRFIAAAFAIAVLQIWLPVSAYARMASPNGLTIEICTPQGLKRLALEASSSPTESPDGMSAGHADHCPLCSVNPAPPGSPASSGATPALADEKRAGTLRSPAPTPQAPRPPATGPPHLS